MLKEFAEYKGRDLPVKVYFANGVDLSGKILELSPEFVKIDNKGVPTIIQMCNILYFHEA